MSATLIHAQLSKQASQDTIYHCLYGYYFLGLKRVELAKIYAKSPTTISSWIERFEKDGHVERKKSTIDDMLLKFNDENKNWLIELYKTRPILYQREASQLFFKEFGQSISTSSISVILHKAGLTWKVLERRAIQLQMQDVCRFFCEMTSFNWFQDQLVFLDEVSFDNMSMLRTHGYAVKGQKLIFRGEFNRTARESLLAFINSKGIVDCYSTEGTFDRKKFIFFCRKFALEHCEQFPGRNSVWILDGAAIHCDPNIITYLRSLGLIVIFLPAYAPMFNPIEVVFGLMKKYLKGIYSENSKHKLTFFIGLAVRRFMNYNLKNIFRKCGYISNGLFDPAIGLHQNLSDMGFTS